MRSPGVGIRLGAAFVGVALAAVAVLAGLTLWASRGEVADLVRRQQAQTAADVESALTDAYREAGSWATADLRPARVLARAADGVLEVRDASGTVLPTPGAGQGRGPRAGAGPPTIPESSVLGEPLAIRVTVDGSVVGTAQLRFPANALPPAEREVRDALARTVLYGSAAAAAVALLVAAGVARWITRPLRALTRAAHAMGGGDRAARSGLDRAPGQLGELAHAFDRMADSLAREDELRRALVADVAHELRTPVTILRGSCEELGDGLAEPTPERLTSLHEEVLRLERVVDDLGTLASAEAAGLRLERRPVDLGEIVGEVITALDPQYRAAGVELETISNPAPVTGDATRLGQVVENLLTNALKFTPAGGVVAVSVGTADGDARLVVEDTGPGIPDDELPRVFDRFWRGRSSHGVAGSGIGLAVVAELVRAHDGRVDAANAPGRGARFTVSLPRRW